MIVKPKSLEEEPQGATNEEAKTNKTIGFYRWRNTALHMYGIYYRYSTVILDKLDSGLSGENEEQLLAYAYAGHGGAGTLCAGNRAPEAPKMTQESVREEKSLFNVMGTTWHTILIFGNNGVKNVM